MCSMPPACAAWRTSARWSARWTGRSTCLALDGVPPVAELAQAGVSRISVGGSFAFAALGAVVSAATELLEQGTYGFRSVSAAGAAAARRAFG